MPRGRLQSLRLAQLRMARSDTIRKKQGKLSLVCFIQIKIYRMNARTHSLQYKSINHMSKEQSDRIDQLYKLKLLTPYPGDPSFVTGYLAFAIPLDLADQIPHLVQQLLTMFNEQLISSHNVFQLLVMLKQSILKISPKDKIPSLSSLFLEPYLNQLALDNYYLSRRFFQKQIPRQQMPIQSMGIQCQICVTDISSKQLCCLSCGHMFHRQCLNAYSKQKIITKSIPFNCPYQNCKTQISQDQLYQYLSRQLRQKYDDFAFHNYVQNNITDTSWCPTPGCAAVFTFDAALTQYKCPTCKKHYCLACKCQFHTNLTCEQYKEIAQLDDDQKKFMLLVRGAKFKQCPSCKFWVEKNQGCDHMTCRCKYQFCYICGGRYNHCKCKGEGSDEEGEEEEEDVIKNVVRMPIFRPQPGMRPLPARRPLLEPAESRMSDIEIRQDSIEHEHYSSDEEEIMAPDIMRKQQRQAAQRIAEENQRRIRQMERIRLKQRQQEEQEKEQRQYEMKKAEYLERRRAEQMKISEVLERQNKREYQQAQHFCPKKRLQQIRDMKTKMNREKIDSQERILYKLEDRLNKRKEEVEGRSHEEQNRSIQQNASRLANIKDAEQLRLVMERQRDKIGKQLEEKELEKREQESKNGLSEQIHRLQQEGFVIKYKEGNPNYSASSEAEKGEKKKDATISKPGAYPKFSDYLQPQLKKSREQPSNPYKVQQQRHPSDKSEFLRLNSRPVASYNLENRSESQGMEKKSQLSRFPVFELNKQKSQQKQGPKSNDTL